MILAYIAYAIVTNVIASVSQGDLLHWYEGYMPINVANAAPNQEIVFTAESTMAGSASLTWKWNNEADPRAGEVKYPDMTACGHERTYRIRPMWLAENGSDRITGIRIYPPNTGTWNEYKAAYTFRSVTVENHRLRDYVNADEVKGVSFSLNTVKQGRGRFRWTVQGEREIRSVHFQIPPDGKTHRRSIDLSGEAGWHGTITWCDFIDSDNRPLNAYDIHLDGRAVELKPGIAVMDARIADFYPRTGAPVPVETIVLNTGSTALRNVRVNDAGPGVDIAPGDVAMLSFSRSDLPAGYTELPVVITADNAEETRTTVRGEITPSLGLPRADYVPAPRPVESEYEIGAIYFPGWHPEYREGTAWKAVWQTSPQRKPVLGWYDESNPEAVDWHLKYLAENGVKFLLVDWYWDRGERSNHEFIDAYYRARYRGNVKWAVHWCNHGGAGTHSTNDFLNVAAFWCTNYFNTAEYYRIDGKPVVMIYSSENIERDMGDGKCADMLGLMRDVAGEYGFSGIYFIGMKWNEINTDLGTINKYKSRGFDMTSIYHYREHDGRVEDTDVFPYSATATANIDTHWNAWYASSTNAGIAFLPHISTGWDDTPWTETRRIYGKSVGEFRGICEKAKAFCERTGTRRFILSPLNEWGEGSYCEPNGEFGFGFYEALRETFCTRPAGGWPRNYTPKDVALGPYGF